MPGMTEVASVDEAAERCVARVREGERTIVQGGGGQGKTFTLTTVRERLPDCTAVFVSPPAGELDVAGAALMQIADGLSLDGAGETLADPERSIIEKTRLLLGMLKDRDDLVLLLDEPDSWPPTGDQDDQLAHRVVDELLATLEGAVVLTARQGAPPWFEDAEILRLPDRGWRIADEAWPAALGEAQTQLHTREQPLSPIAEKLAIGMLALARSNGDTLSVANLPEDTRTLARQLTSRLRRHHDPLLRAWQRLTRTRFGLDEQALRVLDAPLQDTLDGEVLRFCLLSSRPDGFQLHPTLRSNAPTGEIEGLDETHKRLFELFRARNGYVDRLECAHHGLRARSDGSPPDAPILFVEQLDSYGRWLSQKGDRAAAVRVFQSSLELAPDRPYAQHYLAYNLDVQGEEPHEVETNYRAAVAAQPRNIWWHSRLINFLLTRRRVNEAQALFHDALNELEAPELGGYKFLYSSLHRWVARDALFFGDLKFCGEVLADVPEQLLPTIDGLQPIKRRLEARQEARMYGAVAPLGRLGEQWWQSGPASLPSNLPGIGTLTRWLTARIEEIDGDEVALLGVQIELPPPMERPPTRMTRRRLDEIKHAGGSSGETVSVGRHIEVGWYEDGDGVTRAVTMLLPKTQEERLPIPEPHPLRYVQSRVRRRQRSTDDAGRRPLARE